MPCTLQRVEQLLADEHARVERGRRVLEDDRDRASQLAPGAASYAKRSPAEEHLALRGPLQAHQHPGQGRLAAAGLTDHARRSRRGDLEVDAVTACTVPGLNSPPVRVLWMTWTPSAAAWALRDRRVRRIGVGCRAVDGASAGRTGGSPGRPGPDTVRSRSSLALLGVGGVGVGRVAVPGVGDGDHLGPDVEADLGCDDRGAKRSPWTNSRGDGHDAGHLVEARRNRIDRQDRAQQAAGVPWRGLARSSPVGPARRPGRRNMTVIRCATLSYQREVVADEDHREAQLARRSSFEQVDHLLCTVTSSAVVGSSAMTSFGLRVRAIAISTRWRWPPDSSCG